MKLESLLKATGNNTYKTDLIFLVEFNVVLDHGSKPTLDISNKAKYKQNNFTGSGKTAWSKWNCHEEFLKKSVVQSQLQIVGRPTHVYN